MQVYLNLTDPTASTIELDGVIFAQAEVSLALNATPAQTLANGLSVALLTAQGETLAHAFTEASTAVLNTNTVQAYEFTKDLPVRAARGAFLVIGDSTHPMGIIPVEIARNYLADLAPPTESAPIYPTATELQTILEELRTLKKDTQDIYANTQTLVKGFDGKVETAESEAIKAVQDAAKAEKEALAKIVTDASEELDEKVNACQAAADAVEPFTADAAAVRNMANQFFGDEQGWLDLYSLFCDILDVEEDPALTGTAILETVLA